ncbi:MAG: bifunctional pyr operon transcriptional regulator/uracil phosphoribosyltransferase PyrR [Coriobacteriales bacterium]|nr:bifunctional pyr operon transcriptional regulator/uracil phosphoribosyltransferase PyrR [Coriobacteriales bacterium]
MDQLQLKATIMDSEAMRRAVTRIAHEILERNEGAGTLGIVGIVSRGVPIAEILSNEIAAIEGTKPPVGKLDISFYRDDISRSISPVLHATNIPFNLDERDVVLVDDVLYTGRTVRSALDALMDLGRPKSVQLAVMVDRGHRELPIRADYVGKNVPSSRSEKIRVHIKDTDGENSVTIWERPAQGGAN